MPDPDFSQIDLRIESGATVLDLVLARTQANQTQLLPTQPVRQDVGANPLERRPEFGDVHGQNDFRGGMGQKLFHHPNRDETAYLYSRNVDISHEGRLRLPEFDLSNILTPTGGVVAKIVTAGSNLFIGLNKTGNDSIRRTSDLSTFTTENPHGGEATTQALSDLVAEGDRVFAALGTNMVNVRSAAGAWSNYVSVTGSASYLAWLKERLLVTGGSLSGSPTTLYEIDPSGPTAIAIHTLPAGWWFTRNGYAEIGPFIYAVARGPQGQSRIYHYGLNSGGTALEIKGVTEMPRGDVARCCIAIFGMLFIGGHRERRGNSVVQPLAYLGVPSSSGELSLVFVATEDVDPDGSQLADFAVNDLFVHKNKVHMGWGYASPENGYAGSFYGIAVYDPVRESFWYDLGQTGFAAGPEAVTVFKDRRLFSRATTAIYAENTADTSFSQFGILYTSAADWMNAGKKVWDQVEVTCLPIPSLCIFVISYTTDDPADPAAVWTELGQMIGGDTYERFLLDGVVGERFSLAFTFNGSANGSPTLLSYSVRSWPKPSSPEWVLTRHVLIASQTRKDEYADPIYIEDPAATRAQLQDLAYSRVTMYENEATWSVKLESMKDIEPAQPLSSQLPTAQGEGAEDVYVMELQLIGTRT